MNDVDFPSPLLLQQIESLWGVSVHHPPFLLSLPVRQKQVARAWYQGDLCSLSGPSLWKQMFFRGYIPLLSISLHLLGGSVPLTSLLPIFLSLKPSLTHVKMWVPSPWPCLPPKRTGLRCKGELLWEWWTWTWMLVSAANGVGGTSPSDFWSWWLWFWIFRN